VWTTNLGKKKGATTSQGKCECAFFSKNHQCKEDEEDLQKKKPQNK